MFRNFNQSQNIEIFLDSLNLIQWLFSLFNIILITYFLKIVKTISNNLFKLFGVLQAR